MVDLLSLHVCHYHMKILKQKFQVSLNPIRILKHDAEEEKAEVARMSSFIGAIAIGDLVKSTLGPKGMDKILVSCGRNAGQVSQYRGKNMGRGHLF